MNHPFASPACRIAPSATWPPALPPSSADPGAAKDGAS